jgi:hypothetical protein
VSRLLLDLLRLLRFLLGGRRRLALANSTCPAARRLQANVAPAEAAHNGSSSADRPRHLSQLRRRLDGQDQRQGPHPRLLLPDQHVSGVRVPAVGGGDRSAGPAARVALIHRDHAEAPGELADRVDGRGRQTPDLDGDCRPAGAKERIVDGGVTASIPLVLDSVLAFGLYLRTLAPGLLLNDSAEFQTL